MVRLVIQRGFVAQRSNSNGVEGKQQQQQQQQQGNTNTTSANNKVRPKRVSSLNFVDLAGSEKSKKTGISSGQALKEANAINKVTQRQCEAKEMIRMTSSRSRYKN